MMERERAPRKAGWSVAQSQNDVHMRAAQLQSPNWVPG